MAIALTFICNALKKKKKPRFDGSFVEKKEERVDFLIFEAGNSDTGLPLPRDRKKLFFCEKKNELRFVAVRATVTSMLEGKFGNRITPTNGGAHHVQVIGQARHRLNRVVSIKIFPPVTSRFRK